MGQGAPSGEQHLALRTYTSLWQLETMLYRLFDWQMPRPIPLHRAVMVLAVIVPWFTLLKLFHIPMALDGWSVLLWLGPPVVVGWISSKPLAEGKTLPQLARSRVGFWLRPHRWSALEPARRPEIGWVYARVWNPGGPR